MLNLYAGVFGSFFESSWAFFSAERQRIPAHPGSRTRHAQQATQPFETLACFMITFMYITAGGIG
jgi:hypothetical protein